MVDVCNRKRKSWKSIESLILNCCRCNFFLNFSCTWRVSQRKNRIHFSESLILSRMANRLRLFFLRSCRRSFDNNSLLCHLLYTTFCVCIFSCSSLSLFDSELKMRRRFWEPTWIGSPATGHPFDKMNDNDNVWKRMTRFTSILLVKHVSFSLQNCRVVTMYVKVYDYDFIGKDGKHEPKMTVYFIITVAANLEFMP